MQKNLGNLDRILRILAAVIITLLTVTGAVSGIFMIILAILGFTFLATSLIGICPLYRLLGMSTRHNAPAAEAKQ